MRQHLYSNFDGQLNNQICKKLCIVPPSEDSNHGTTKQLCQIGHAFACVAPGPSNNHIIKLFKSKQRGEIITI